MSKIYFDPSIYSIVKEWKQTPQKEWVKIISIKLTTNIIKLRQEQNGSKMGVLVDCRCVYGELFSADLIDWYKKNIHFLYSVNGIYKKALLASQDNLCNHSIARYIEQSNDVTDELDIRLFYNEQEARQWLGAHINQKKHQ